MADNFLAKWRGRSSSTDPVADEARAELQQLADRRPALRGPALWLRDLLPDLAAPSTAPLPSLSQEVVQAKLAAGAPLLRGERIPVDEKAFRHRWRRACDALRAYQDDDSAARLAGALAAKRLAPRELTDAMLAGRPETIHAHVAALQLDAGLATTILRFTLFPQLTAIHAAWASQIADKTWERSECPTCGNEPLLGEFRGLDQVRYLRCGWCAAAWKVPRLFCPFCGNRDHETLGLLHREGEENRLRAATCDGCRRSLKMLSTLAELPPLRLWTADAVTLHLNLAAAERGYW